jgi:hypothetical protein
MRATWTYRVQQGCVLSLLLAFGSGCEGSVGSGEPAGEQTDVVIVREPTSPTVQSFCAEGAGVTCQAVAGCCSFDVATCVNLRTAGCVEDVGSALAHQFGFVPSVANECVAALGAVYNGCALSTSPEAQLAYELCSQVTVGLVPPGSVCELDAQCKAEPESQGRCINGVCQVEVAWGEGTACVPQGAEFCGPGLFCDPSSGAPVCRALVDVGGQCMTPEACRAPSVCSEGLCTAVTSLNAFCAGLSAEEDT